MLFADVSDIEARWRTLDSAERDRAQALIQDASAALTKLVHDIDEEDDEQMQLLNLVCSNMVIRVMSATAADTYGASNMSMTAGPYTQQWTYSNPSGDLYVTKFEKRLLGITSGYIRSIRPMLAGEHDD